MLLALLACVRAPMPAVAPPPPAPVASSEPAPASVTPAPSGSYGPSRPTIPPATLSPIPVEIPIPAHAAELGPADAAVVVVTWSDFQCPFCAHLIPQVMTLAARRPDVRFVFAHFPLETECNPIMRSDMHPYACDAARAAMCADQQGKYPAMAKLLYEMPEQITPPALPLFAERAGLDRVAFDACLAAPETAAALAAHVATGAELGIDGTPTVLARGLDGPGWALVTGEASAIIKALEAAPRR